MAVMLSENVRVSGPLRPTHHDRVAHVASLRRMTDLLCPQDRLLVELVGSGQCSLREVARMTDQNAGQLSRKLKVLWARLHDPFVRHLLDGRCPLRPEVRQVGVEKYLLGLTLAEITTRHDMHAGQVTEVLSFLKGYALAKGMKT